MVVIVCLRRKEEKRRGPCNVVRPQRRRRAHYSLPAASRAAGFPAPAARRCDAPRGIERSHRQSDCAVRGIVHIGGVHFIGRTIDAL
ncbi:MAG: hypothetical protein M3Y67_00350 [Pseudomonadota bacterium]|nr:hypothetical protein [Pseudomonadota bacterium]